MDRKTAQMISPMLDGAKDTVELKKFHAIAMGKVRELTDDPKVLQSIEESIEDISGESQLIGLQVGLVNGISIAKL